MLEALFSNPVVAKVVVAVYLVNMALIALAAFCQKLADLIGEFCDQTGTDVDNKIKAALLKVVAGIGWISSVAAKILNFATANGVKVPSTEKEKALAEVAKAQVSADPKP